MIKKNKKGDKLISVYWFAILVIVATGVVIMVHSFYGSPYDVREMEAQILSQKVADCIYFAGKPSVFLMNSDETFRDLFKDSFMQKCHLNFESNKEFVPPQYYVELNIYKGSKKESSDYNHSEGNKNWAGDCDMEVVGRDKLATCLDKEFFMIGEKGGLYLVEIKTIIGKVAENVK